MENADTGNPFDDAATDAPPPERARNLPYVDQVRKVPPREVFHWLQLATHDIREGGLVSPLYGGVFVLAGYGMTFGLSHLGMAYLITPMIGSFLLIAPLLALGLYQISKDVEEGRKPRLIRALTAWRRNPYHILTAGLVLMLFVMIWARLNVVAFALFFPYTPIDFAAFVGQMLSWQGIAFTLFITGLGTCFAGFAFITNVITLPMMLDHDIDVFGAGLVSVVAVFKNPRTVALWAALIVVITGIGLLTAFVGLALTLPLIGHASWHAYRALVEPGEPAP